MIQGKEYIYLGDKIARCYLSEYIGQKCYGVLRNNGKCIRGRNGNMLVMFGNVLVNVPARQLRKVDILESDSILKKGKIKLHWKQLALF